MTTTTTFDPIDFHERAVRTPSHEDVDPMRDLLRAELGEHGVDPEVDDAGNVLATREASEPGPHIVLNTHIDTVPPHVPFERAPAGDDAVVAGRGSCDAKGPLAALLDAFLRVDLSAGRVTLAVTPDEETESTGAAALDLGADGYIVGEPTGLDVCNAAKGRFLGRITVRGESAHAAEPESGVNAIRAAGTVLTVLDRYDDDRGPGVHDSLGGPKLTATRIRGGEAPNQVPESCRITVDRRSVPPETADGFRRDFAEFLREHAPTNASVDFEFVDRSTPYLEPFTTPAEDPLVETLQRTSGGAIRPFSAATEASYFASEAPTVVFGPGVLADEEGAVAHSRREYVRLPDVERAAAAVRKTLAVFLEGQPASVS